MSNAPIIIPTLNRRDHLKRCLESLMKNVGAEDTDVYISVDFPPAERYVSGYLDVKSYLETADFSGFHAVHVFYQKENLGAKENWAFLRNAVSEAGFDCYIFTEDDNEFSPNFLDYINKGLDLFSQDGRVIGICAAKDAPWESEDHSILFSKLFPAYGFGTWFEKEAVTAEDCRAVLLPDRMYGVRTMLRLFRRNKGLFRLYVCNILCRDDGLFWNEDGSLYLCDSVRSLYMHFTDKVCVVPSLGKSRTWGNDGSGLNMPKSDRNPAEDVPLDGQETFEYGDVKNLHFIEKNYSVGNQYMSCGSWRADVLVPMVYYGILLLCFGKRERALRLVRKVRKLLRKQV